MYFVPEGQHDRSLARSGWDCATPKEPSRRVRYDSCRCAHRFEDWREEISNAVSVSRIEMIRKCIGGVLHHVRHIVTLRTRLAVAKAVQLINDGSSVWIQQRFPNLRSFAWQPYSASISRRHAPLLGAADRTSSDTNLLRVFRLPKETRREFRREIPVGSPAPDHTVPYGTVLSRDAFPGTSCLATISLSLRDKSHSP
jgi:hypothetical protein